MTNCEGRKHQEGDIKECCSGCLGGCEIAMDTTRAWSLGGLKAQSWQTLE